MSALLQGLGLKVKGRPDAAIPYSVDGDLTDEDLDTLLAGRDSQPNNVKKLRERHHMLARLLTNGNMTDGEVALASGFSISRISILKGDPAFIELMEFYRVKVDAKYLDMHEQLSGLSKDAVLTLRERLEDEPEAVSTRELIEMTKLGADRTGFGPSSKQEVNVKIGLADRLAKARKRVEDGQLIDVTPVEAQDE